MVTTNTAVVSSQVRLSVSDFRTGARNGVEAIYSLCAFGDAQTLLQTGRRLQKKNRFGGITFSSTRIQTREIFSVHGSTGGSSEAWVDRLLGNYNWPGVHVSNVCSLRDSLCFFNGRCGQSPDDSRFNWTLIRLGR
jgi:hypothetical protein